MAESIDRATFLANLRQSGLLTPEQLQAATARLPDTNRGRLVARSLVEQGFLTRFQAELLLAGRTQGFFLGQYRILDQLGRGGMGRVFKAEHRTMNRVVALKVLSSALVKTEKAQQLFQREVRAAARLVHPNIVTAFDANQIDNRYFLVMEYVNGLNLDELVRQRGPLPVGMACDCIRQVAQGLQFASEQGMVHRDIKPANILMQQVAPAHGQPGYLLFKVLDFGLARLHSRSGNAEAAGTESILTAENTVMGTPDFLSPEQARNVHKVDIRSDLYSLGCTFYFLLTGKVPYPGGTVMEKLVRHNTEEPTPVEKLRPEVPEGLAAVVRKLMAKDPAQRYQTPAELGPALAPFAQQTLIPAAGRAPATPPPTASLTTPPPVAVPVAQPVADPRNVFDFYAADNDTPPSLDDEATDIGHLPLELGAAGSMVGPASMKLQRQYARRQNRQLTVSIIIASVVVAGLLGLAGWLMLR